MTVRAVVCGVLVIVCAGCASLSPERRAVIRELRELGYEYSRADFWRAVKRCHHGGVELFLLAGIDPDIRDPAGDCTALQWLVQGPDTCMIYRWYPDVGLIKLLLKRGSDANAVYPKWAGTALDLALWEGHLDTAWVLREHGAETRLRPAESYPAFSRLAETGRARACRKYQPRTYMCDDTSGRWFRFSKPQLEHMHATPLDPERFGRYIHSEWLLERIRSFCTPEKALPAGYPSLLGDTVLRTQIHTNAAHEFDHIGVQVCEDKGEGTSYLFWHGSDWDWRRWNYTLNVRKGDDWWVVKEALRNDFMDRNGQEDSLNPGCRVQVSVVPVKNAFRLGDKVKLLLSLTNVGEVPVAFRKQLWDRGGWCRDFGYNVTLGGKGKDAFPCPALGGGPYDTVVLQPGDSDTRELNVWRVARFDEVGRYEIKCSIPLDFFQSPRAGHRFEYKGCWGTNVEESVFVAVVE